MRKTIRVIKKKKVKIMSGREERQEDAIKDIYTQEGSKIEKKIQRGR